mgnify:FL=1
MKHLLTLESYYSYKDFERGRWGTPSEIEEDLRMSIIKLLTYADIADNLDDVIYVDQSSDKGIKWEITIKHAEGKDILHAYKRTNWRGQYEFYLNKKKSSEYEIQQMFLQKFVSPLDQYLASMKSFDKHYQYADDNGSYKSGSAHADRLREMYKVLKSAEKKKAYKEFVKKHKTELPFKDFSGA